MKGVETSMEKIGYILLISAYLLIFPIANGLSNKLDSSLNESLSQERLAKEISYNLHKSLGVSSFLEKIDIKF